MGLSGVSLWGSDIGGFFALSLPQTTPELLRPLDPARLRLGRHAHAGQRLRAARRRRARRSSTRTCCRSGRATRGCARSSTRTWRRRRREYERTGMPIMRQLALAYPDDPPALAREDEELFGPDLLVAPVLTPGQTSAVASTCRRGGGSSAGASVAARRRRRAAPARAAVIHEGGRRVDVPGAAGRDPAVRAGGRGRSRCCRRRRADARATTARARSCVSPIARAPGAAGVPADVPTIRVRGAADHPLRAAGVAGHAGAPVRTCLRRGERALGCRAALALLEGDRRPHSVLPRAQRDSASAEGRSCPADWLPLSPRSSKWREHRGHATRTWPVAAGSLVLGFAVAEITGVRRPRRPRPRCCSSVVLRALADSAAPERPRAHARLRGGLRPLARPGRRDHRLAGRLPSRGRSPSRPRTASKTAPRKALKYPSAPNVHQDPHRKPRRNRHPRGPRLQGDGHRLGRRLLGGRSRRAARPARR